MEKDPFEEYIKNAEATKQEKGYAWQTAIGLQAVDGLKTSDYLKNTAIRNIEGEISFKEANDLLQSYYAKKPSKPDEKRTEEADKVSARIAALLSEKTFNFSANEYLSIHKKLFTGIYKHAGQIRDYNITKKEWVLDGQTVLYGSATELKATLDYDIAEEKKFSYQNLSKDEVIHHYAVFVSNLWQNHVFGEGNTRTTAVFFIKYLRKHGFNVTNDIFAKNAWYFRNALVRANYTDIKNGIHETTEFLELFLRNLLLSENNPLQNRTLHIKGIFNQELSKPDIGDSKPDIGDLKPDIGDSKPDIGDSKPVISNNLKLKTEKNIQTIREAFSDNKIFGRTDIMKVIGLKESRASELLNMMLNIKIIEPVSGHGKGKYKFKE